MPVMAIKIEVPLSSVQEALGGFLVLDHPARCSRCGTLRAEHYETHKLRLRIGANKPGLYRQTYKVSRVYYLRLRVCESCYKSDFAVYPEEFEKDDTALGSLARLHSRLYTTGTIIACAGLLFMTSLIPTDSVLGSIKPYWPFITAPGGLIILGVWLHQRSHQRRILESLEKAGIDPTRHPRTEVRTPVLDNEDDPGAIPLQIKMKDEEWAAECATRYNWKVEYEPKGEEQQ